MNEKEYKQQQISNTGYCLGPKQCPGKKFNPKKASCLVCLKKINKEINYVG